MPGQLVLAGHAVWPGKLVLAGHADRYRIPYQIGYDPTEAVGARYDLPGLPVTFFLSTSGKRILGINIGALTARSLTAILHQLYGHL